MHEMPSRDLTSTFTKMKPSDAATYERARRLANLALWTVALQRRRLDSTEHFFVVALSRLRRSVALALKIGALKSKMKDALWDFDLSLPHLKIMRDVAEHIDDYAIDAGRIPTISRKSLEISSRNGGTWQWLGFATNTESAFVAAIRLFDALKSASNDLR
jgi:hypothetical protein